MSVIPGYRKHGGGGGGAYPSSWLHSSLQSGPDIHYTGLGSEQGLLQTSLYVQ